MTQVAIAKQEASVRVKIEDAGTTSFYSEVPGTLVVEDNGHVFLEFTSRNSLPYQSEGIMSEGRFWKDLLFLPALPYHAVRGFQNKFRLRLDGIHAENLGHLVSLKQGDVVRASWGDGVRGRFVGDGKLFGGSNSLTFEIKMSENGSIPVEIKSVTAPLGDFALSDRDGKASLEYWVQETDIEKLDLAPFKLGSNLQSQRLGLRVGKDKKVIPVKAIAGPPGVAFVIFDPKTQILDRSHAGPANLRLYPVPMALLEIAPDQGEYDRWKANEPDYGIVRKMNRGIIVSGAARRKEGEPHHRQVFPLDVTIPSGSQDWRPLKTILRDAITETSFGTRAVILSEWLRQGFDGLPRAKQQSEAGLGARICRRAIEMMAGAGKAGK